MIDWIPIDDGVPDFDEDLLVCSEGFVYYATFNGKFKQNGIDCLYLPNVSHWTYFPEPPKGLTDE